MNSCVRQCFCVVKSLVSLVVLMIYVPDFPFIIFMCSISFFLSRGLLVDAYACVFNVFYVCDVCE